MLASIIIIIIIIIIITGEEKFYKRNFVRREKHFRFWNENIFMNDT